MEPIEIVRKVWDEVYAKGNMESAGQYFASSYVVHDPLRGKMNLAEARRDMERWSRAFPDMKAEMLDSASAGDKVFVRWRCTGTHKGEFAGARATNQRVALEGITESRVKNGKIEEEWTHFDSLGLLRQIGILPEQVIAGLRQESAGGDGRQKEAQPAQQQQRK